MSGGEILIAFEEVERFCTECLSAVGAKKSHAEAVAKVLATADHRGHYSHGLNRLEMYVNDLKETKVNTAGEPKILKESVSTAYIDGNNCLGPVVGNFSMKIAIEKAKKTGIGWAVAKNSNHYGIAGWYSMLASEEGLIGLSLTNTSPLVYPTRSKQTAIGTNPISVAAPGKSKDDSMIIDMATSAVALGKLEMKRRSNLPIPLGWAADSEGRVTNDPNKAISGGLLPLGGTEETGGYKGFCLAVMVEIFCGILADSAYGGNIRNWKDRTKIANLGQCFAAIDPNAFAPGFPERITKFGSEIRGLPRENSDKPVLIPGDPERIHIKNCETIRGIPYVSVLIDSMNQLGSKLKVKGLTAMIPK